MSMRGEVIAARLSLFRSRRDHMRGEELRRGPAAVDRQHLPGDEARLVRKQEADRLGGILAVPVRFSGVMSMFMRRKTCAFQA
jgi:hypothetical protein